jgi:hypothetical protein
MDIIAVYSENHKIHINTLCGQFMAMMLEAEHTSETLVYFETT